jgi:ABC-2 type transport system ATP-binding protein
MIQAQGLTKYYGDLCAVDQIDFLIRQGEILGLLGPNGAGKTTVLRMLTGFLRPTAGTIQVNDLDIGESALQIKRLLGYLPESAPLYQEMLAYDYLDYVARIRGFSGEKKLSRIRELAELCGLHEVMHKPIGQLSKGFKQRVGLAHAMMSDPEVLVLDEPTSGLDPNQIMDIREIIKRIGKKKTIVLSTHILNEVEATCDRVLIIHRGKIVADGSTETLKQSAGGEYDVRMVLQGGNLETLKKGLEAIEGVRDIRSFPGEEETVNLKLHCRSSGDLRPEIYRQVRQSDCVLLEFLQETRSLENIFRELTKEN